MADIKDIKLGNTKYNIKIPSSRVKSMADYAKPSSKPSPEAIQQSDTLNAALGKLEYKADTNQTNILYGLQTGVKNIIRLNPGTYTDNVATFTVNNDGEVIVNSGSAGTSAITIGEFELPAGDYVYWYDGTASSGKCDVRLMNGSTRLSGAFTLSSATTIHADVYSYAVNSNTVIKPMLCTAEAWAQEPNVYRPPALPNYDLTRLESEDRVALAEEIDAGAKNLVPMTWTNADPFADIHMTKNSDDSITVTATNTAATRIVSLSTNINNYLTVGKKYVLSGCDGGDYNNHYGFALSTSNYTGRVFEVDGSEEFTYASEVVNFTLLVRAGESWTKTFKPMICTLADWKVSQKFVPYRMPYSQALTLLNQKAPSNVADYVASGSVDDLPSGCALCGPNVTGKPISDNYFIIRTRIYDANCAEQEAIAPAGNRRFNRTKWGGTWTSWVEYAIKS